MTYTLTFHDTERDRTRFRLLYQGFVAAGNRQQQKGIETLRREVGILDALDPIGIRPADLPIDVEGVLELRPGVGAVTVTIDKPAKDLLVGYLKSVPWATTRARQALDLIDWLDALPPDA